MIVKTSYSESGHNRRWHPVTCTKAKPPTWKAWQEHDPKQGGLGFGGLFLFCFLIERACIVSLTYYLTVMNMHQ